MQWSSSYPQSLLFSLSEMLLSESRPGGQDGWGGGSHIHMELMSLMISSASRLLWTAFPKVKTHPNKDHRGSISSANHIHKPSNWFCPTFPPIYIHAAVHWGWAQRLRAAESDALILRKAHRDKYTAVFASSGCKWLVFSQINTSVILLNSCSVADFKPNLTYCKKNSNWGEIIVFVFLFCLSDGCSFYRIKATFSSWVNRQLLWQPSSSCIW